jgi:two-component system phosphate regulon sensor histidine kinase PhoR
MIKNQKAAICRTYPNHIATLEHERLISLINSMADGVIAVDEHQAIAIYNGAALNILDVNGDLQGKSISKLLKVIDPHNKPVDIEHLIKSTQTPMTDRDLRLLYPNNETINLYISIAPVHLGFGVKGQRGHVLLLRDITHEKSLEEERDEFISVVSHELRTPIAIAEGNISNAQFAVSKDSDIPEAIKESLRAAHDQILFLSGMVNDLATLSRAERGKLNIEVEAINIVELVNDLVQNYEPSANQKGLKLLAHLDPDLSLLKSSRLYVREILQNFLTNAIRYTQEGSVTILAKPQAKGVLFSISDTGIGIGKTDKAKVFDKFFRSEDYRTRQFSGTGLGLYVTKKLAHLLKAELNLESELNKGSTFSVYVPNVD